MEFETFVFIVAVVLAMLFVGILTGRRNAGQIEQKMCASCGAPHPVMARFCRRCGKKLTD
jgi:predicted amidophosphoribosyltransferase